MVAELHYSIAPKKPSAHLFEVTVHVAVPDATGQEIAFPAWIPGSYLIRDLARHVVSIHATSEGQEIELTKIRNNAWQAGLCTGPLTITAEIYAFDQSVRGAYLDTSRGFFDGASMFPAVVGQEARPCELEILPPSISGNSEWRVATSMRSRGAGKYAFGVYGASSYAELIDHPVEMGRLRISEFEVSGVPHALVVNSAATFDIARVCGDLETLCRQQLAFLGIPADLDRYCFLLNVRESGYGGLEHGWSSSLTCSRKDLPRSADSTPTTISSDYRKFLGLCSHEYFHLWNVKRIKPAQFTPYRLDNESHTGLLWVFEGITSYYDDLLLLRSGLISVESYLELLGKTVTRVQKAPGRMRQSLEESSFDAWTKLYKPNENSSNAGISYYTKGSLVALALDLTIRRKTAGKCSLDDVMQECWKLYGQSGEGMPERGIEAVAESVSGLSLQEFFEPCIRGTVDLPLAELLQTVGIRLIFSDGCSANETDNLATMDGRVASPWAGAEVSRQHGVDRVTVVHSDSPAEKAGIVPGDELVALNGLRINAANMAARLREHQVGDAVNLSVFRDHTLQQYRVTLGESPQDVCSLTLDNDADARQEKARLKWLGVSAL